MIVARSSSGRSPRTRTTSPETCARSSSGVPVAATRPPSRIAIRWQRSASSGWCVVTMTLVPRAAASAVISSQIRRSASGSTPRPGSSSSSSDGSCSSTRAISMRRRMPPEYFDAGSSARSPSAISASASSMRRAASARGTPYSAAPRRRFSRAVSFRSRLASWNTTPRCARYAVSVVDDGAPVERQRARVRRQQAREQAERGRLARPVGPEQAEHLAGRDLEADAVERGACPEPARQSLGAKARGAVPGRGVRGRRGHATVRSMASATNSKVR